MPAREGEKRNQGAPKQGLHKKYRPRAEEDLSARSVSVGRAALSRGARWRARREAEGAKLQKFECIVDCQGGCGLAAGPSLQFRYNVIILVSCLPV